MPLYIKDEAVDQLAIRYQKATGAASKTAAVRLALREGLKAMQAETPLIDKLGALQSQADEIGAVDPAFDSKAFADDLWEDR